MHAFSTHVVTCTNTPCITPAHTCAAYMFLQWRRRGYARHVRQSLRYATETFQSAPPRLCTLVSTVSHIHHTHINNFRRHVHVAIPCQHRSYIHHTSHTIAHPLAHHHTAWHSMSCMPTRTPYHVTHDASVSLHPFPCYQCT